MPLSGSSNGRKTFPGLEADDTGLQKISKSHNIGYEIILLLHLVSMASKLICVLEWAPQKTSIQNSFPKWTREHKWLSKNYVAAWAGEGVEYLKHTVTYIL